MPHQPMSREHMAARASPGIKYAPTAPAAPRPPRAAGFRARVTPRRRLGVMPGRSIRVDGTVEGPKPFRDIRDRIARPVPAPRYRPRLRSHRTRTPARLLPPPRDL